MVGVPSLVAARPVAWRYFVLIGDHAAAATEIRTAGEGGLPRWSYHSYDPRNQTRFAAVQRAARDERYQGTAYVARYLRIPSLDLTALLWLKPRRGDDDIVIPLGRQAFLRPGWPYTLPGLFRSLKRHALRRLACSNLPAVEQGN
jgi:hypothetical protein